MKSPREEIDSIIDLLNDVVNYYGTKYSVKERRPLPGADTANAFILVNISEEALQNEALNIVKLLRKPN